MTPPFRAVPTTGRVACSGPEARMRSKPDFGHWCSRVLLAASVLVELAFECSPRGFLVADEVRRLGERVVAQVHDHELRRQRLFGVPGRALGLTAATLGAGREVEEALPGEVLDLAAAEHGVLGGVLEVDLLCP